MTPRAGQNLFPITISWPDNSDLVNPAAATVNVGGQGVQDAVTYVHLRLATAPACSWEALIAIGAATDNAAWSTKAGIWWAVGGGNADRVNQSTDWGKTWTNINPGLGSLQNYSVDFDGSANAVVANDASRTVYNFTKSPSAWTSDTNVLIGTVNKPLVRFDPVNSIWCVFYNDTTAVTGGERAATSTDRIAWTDRSAALPAGLMTAGTYVSHMGAGGGFFVVAAKISGTTITGARSSGATPGTWNGWTITAAVITTLTDCSNPVYSADDAAWLIALYGTTAGNGVTEIWQSTDNGLTWTRVSTIQTTAWKFIQLANIGHMFAALTIDGQVAYSTDIGVTWFLAGMQVVGSGATHTSMWSGGGGLMAFDGVSANARGSAIRLSNLGTPALT